MGTLLPSDGVPIDESSDPLGPLYRGSSNRPALPGTIHPLVWVHPPTGRRALLAAPMWMRHLEWADGSAQRMSPAASQLFFEALIREANASIYTHKWRVGDFVVWDNRALYHTATPNDGFSDEGLRLLHRVRMAGTDAPERLA